MEGLKESQNAFKKKKKKDVGKKCQCDQKNVGFLFMYDENFPHTLPPYVSHVKKKIKNKQGAKGFPVACLSHLMYQEICF